MKIEYKKARKLDDLLVGERENQVFLSHKDAPSGGILCLSDSEFDSLTGRQVMRRFNDYVESILNSIKNERPREIPDGEPQLRWSKECHTWTAAGDVLRCVVAWDRSVHGENGVGELAIQIDDKLLTWQEFLKLIETQEGWGMRIEFMHPNRLTNPPKPIPALKKEKD